MTSRCVLCVLCGLLAMPGLAPAQEKNVNVAVVDLAYIFENYDIRTDLESKFEKLRQDMAAEAKRRKEAIDRKRDVLLTRKPESKDFAELEQEISRMQIEFTVWVEYQEKTLKNKHREWFLRIYTNIRETVAEVSVGSSVDLVLTYKPLEKEATESIEQQILLQNIIYFDDRIDLTQAVLNRLNEKYEKAGGAANLKISLTTPSDMTKDRLEESLSARS